MTTTLKDGSRIESLAEDGAADEETNGTEELGWCFVWTMFMLCYAIDACRRWGRGWEIE